MTMALGIFRPSLHNPNQNQDGVTMALCDDVWLTNVRYAMSQIVTSC
jgi:hypothetical protein